MIDKPDEDQPTGNLPTPVSIPGLVAHSPLEITTLQNPSRDQDVYVQGGVQNVQPPIQTFFPQQYSQQYRQNSHGPPQNQGRASLLNMRSLGESLPDVSYGQIYGHHSPSSPLPPVGYQGPQGPQFQGQSIHNQAVGPPYGMQYPSYHGLYQPQQHGTQQGSSPGHQFYSNQGFMAPMAPQPPHPPPYFYPHNQYQTQSPIYPTGHYPPQFIGRTGSVGSGISGPSSKNEQLSTGAQPGSSLVREPSTSSATGHSPIPRGPPRKPKQSGHALWVGNLPPGANVSDLKDHFSQDATEDILSVFLISKSNCAFVNYKTEESCAAAMTRFHDSRFFGVRLVCRLRRSSVNAGPGVPTGPAALSVPPVLEPKTPSPEQGSPGRMVEGGGSASGEQEQPQPRDKFFVVKSLTIEDLESSVRNGSWATQSHNEEALNKAYEAVDDVYLIFSANKSGEYFGYARMTSPINNDPAAAIQFAPQVVVDKAKDSELPRAIPTSATASAPRGRIIDDSARGTIFWEAETTEFADEGSGEDAAATTSDDASDEPVKAWGKPFSIEWLSTTRLPFYRTRGLRNPWNSNREVKIARDGTELETLVGRRLIQMFHHQGSPAMASHMLAYPPVRTC